MITIKLNSTEAKKIWLQVVEQEKHTAATLRKMAAAVRLATPLEPSEPTRWESFIEGLLPFLARKRKEFVAFFLAQHKRHDELIDQAENHDRRAEYYTVLSKKMEELDRAGGKLWELTPAELHELRLLPRP